MFSGGMEKQHQPEMVSPLSTNTTKWSNTLKQFVGHFVGLALKGLTYLLLGLFLNCVPCVSPTVKYIYTTYDLWFIVLIGDPEVIIVKKYILCKKCTCIIHVTSQFAILVIYYGINQQVTQSSIKNIPGEPNKGKCWIHDILYWSFICTEITKHFCINSLIFTKSK